MSRYAVILGTGRYVPERRVTNAELERELGEPVDEWLVKNVGIRARHYLAPEQAASDLAVEASRTALKRAGVAASELDLVIVATDTPDQPSPGTSAIVHAKLGATGAGAFDVNCACASWTTALDLASKSIAADPHCRKVLVVGTYAMSRFLEPKAKNTATLFADGGGAVVLGVSEQPGYLGGRTIAFTHLHDAMGIFTGGSARPATAETVRDAGPQRVEIRRKVPASFNVEQWPLLIREVAGRAGLPVSEMALFLFTQLNLRAIEDTMTALGQPLSRTHWTMDKWGYTGSACLPMTLDDAVEQGKLHRGDPVLFCASGGGVAMAASLFRWTL
jgi:3-oxoacyl-[acyl-carrier-protein] synthase-3